jgi:hypothetical protein
MNNAMSLRQIDDFFIRIIDQCIKKIEIKSL